VTGLVWLNLLLPVVLGWLIILERRISRIEGYMRGHQEGQLQTRQTDNREKLKGGVG